MGPGWPEWTFLDSTSSKSALGQCPLQSHRQLHLSLTLERGEFLNTVALVCDPLRFQNLPTASSLCCTSLPSASDNSPAQSRHPFPQAGSDPGRPHQKPLPQLPGALGK